MSKQIIEITTEYIKLDSFLKLTGAVATGGEAKESILAGQVLVNGEPCLQRGRKLRAGMVVSMAEQEFEVKDREA